MEWRHKALARLAHITRHRTGSLAQAHLESRELYLMKCKESFCENSLKLSSSTILFESVLPGAASTDSAIGKVEQQSRRNRQE